MAETQRNIASFLLRFTQDLWQDADGDPKVAWRGRINHVQGEDEAAFTDFGEVVAFIQQHLTQLTLDAASGTTPMDQEKVLKESFKLWEQFATTYSDAVLGTVERTMQQSQALSSQMEEAMEQAVQGWQRTLQPQQAQLTEQVETLQQQVDALTATLQAMQARLDALEHDRAAD